MSGINDQDCSVQVTTPRCSLGSIPIWHAGTSFQLSVLSFCVHHSPVCLSAHLSSCYLPLSSLFYSLRSFLRLNLLPQKLPAASQLEVSKRSVFLTVILIKLSFEVTLLPVNKTYTIPLCCLGMFGGDIMTVLDFLQCPWCANLSLNDTPPLVISGQEHSQRHCSVGARDMYICV